MNQLPAKLAHDKQSILCAFREAHQVENKPKWRFLKKSGMYCSELDGVFYKPKIDHFLHDFEKKD